LTLPPRNEIISAKRRWNPTDKLGNQVDDPKIDLSHFDTVEWGPAIVPKVKEFLEMVVESNQMGEYIQALTDIDRLKRHWGIIGLRKILSIQIQTPIQDIIDQNIVP
jgi:importin subunit alpha-1